MAKVKNKSMMSTIDTRPFDLRKMCTPATLYFIISLVFLVIMGVNNLQDTERLCLGDYSCYVGNNTMIFLLNAVYILFWTFLLDLMCKNGYSTLSWFVLLLPFILSFLFLALIMIKAV
jgi:hypothetical protein